MSESQRSGGGPGFESFPLQAYESLDLAGLAAFAINRLQELQVAVTFENTVVALYTMFPRKFGLEGFDEYPDAARVGRTLLQLGPKYRNWARGSVQKGFMLTESGKVKAAAIASALAAGGKTTRTPRSATNAAPRTMDLRRELDEVEGSSLFQRWQVGRVANGEPREFFDLLGAYAYTPVRALRDRLQFLENAARQLDRADLLSFFGSVRSHFAQYFRG